MITVTPAGLYCQAGDFWIDPWRPVPRAIITHAHSDHARAGSEHYVSSRPSEPLLRHRLGADIHLTAWDWGVRHTIGGVEVSLHPAGHILGSAQVRVSDGQQTWVVSGDYKRDADPTCEPFEVVPCDTFITEATFALPVYRWPSHDQVMDDIFDWWTHCRNRGQSAVLLCYSLGKAQRILAGMADRAPDPVLLHGAMHELTAIYRQQGVRLADTERVSDLARRDKAAGRLILAPPSAMGTPWMQRFTRPEVAFASGWMTIRGVRRQRGYDRGFVVSDHADWAGLVTTIRQTGCRRVLATHGNTTVLVRWLLEQGLDAAPLQTLYGGEGDGPDTPESPPAPEGESP